MLHPVDADALLASAVLTDKGRQDPYAAYERMRSELPRWQSSFGPTVLTTYDDCMEVLRNPKLGRPEPDMPQGRTLSGRPARSREDSTVMLFLNPPDHTRIRGLVARAFTPRRVERLRPRLGELLTPLLERIAANGGGDVIQDLAIPFPVAVISELLGVPRVDSHTIAPYVHDGARLIDAAADEDVIARGEVATAALAEYFVELASHKRDAPDDGLFSALIDLEAEGDRLSEEELISNTILLYAAGFETTSNLIGNGLRLLLEHPGELERLRNEPQLMPSAIWEMLRHDSPVQLNVRAVLADTEVLGERRARGDGFLVLQASGNHDELVYENPQRFDIGRFAPADPHAAHAAASDTTTREESTTDPATRGAPTTGEGAVRQATMVEGTPAPVPTPLSFGWGAHHCLGAHLARAEGEILFAGLLERFEHIELDSAALRRDGRDRPHYRESFTLRGLESLPVTVS